MVIIRQKCGCLKTTFGKGFQSLCNEIGKMDGG